MKKITSLLMLTIALFIFNSTNAQVRFTENFQYPAGDTIGGHGWSGIFNGGNIPIYVVSPGLTYAGYPLSGIGNAAAVGKVGSDYYNNFSVPDSTGSVYCSFMMRVDSATTTGDYFFAFLPSTSTSLYTSRLTIRDTLTGQFRFGLSKGTVANGVGFSDAYPKGVTLLVVVKYQFNPATLDDLTSLYVFTSGFPVTEPAVATIIGVPSLSGDATNLGRVALRQGTATSAPYVVIDGMRVGKNWSDIATSVTPISTIAESFKLSQNYPNPFNPTTKINFSLPVNGNVSLKVYDAIGKEVSNLVNGRLNSGSYTVDFNGSNLNSGVYFYKIVVSGENGSVYSDMKKLMLVK